MNVFSNQNRHKISGKCDIVIGTKGVQFKNTCSTYSVQDIEFGTRENKILRICSFQRFLV